MAARASGPLVVNGTLVLWPERMATAYPDLLGLFAAAYLAGVRRAVVLDVGAERDGARGLKQFNRLLGSRGLERMAIKRVAPDTPLAGTIRELWAEHDSAGARRPRLPAEDGEGEGRALRELQSIRADDPNALFAASPMILADACTGCDACLRVCPHGVLTQVKDGGPYSHYNAKPGSCDGCGLCVDVCSSGAIKVLTMVNAPDDIPLTNWLCPVCAAPTRAPVIQGRDGGSCPICAATGHHKKLFQVLS